MPLARGDMHFLHNTQYKYRPTIVYDLDAIISVGYRVKSKRGTAFRIWARKIIKDYLVKGYAVSERIRKEQIGELRQLVGMLGRTIQSHEVAGSIPAPATRRKPINKGVWKWKISESLFLSR